MFVFNNKIPLSLTNLQTKEFKKYVISIAASDITEEACMNSSYPKNFKDLEVLVEASVENKVADVHVETLQKRKTKKFKSIA